MKVHEIIIEQMGGINRLVAMVGAHSFRYLELEQNTSLFFKFRMNPKMNTLKVTYDYAKDLYEMEFSKATPRNYKALHHYTDVYAEDLIPIFESTTGLDLRL